MELMVEADITCPHCGETFPLQLDTSQAEQTLVEDCTVCCRPMTISVQARPGEIRDLQVER